MIENNDFLKDAIVLAKSFHSSDTTGHDWWHVYRVWKMAKHSAQREGADILLVELAALLHDMDDHKIEGADWENFPNARKTLHSVNADNDLIEKVIGIIKEVSFKGANVDTTPTSLEASVVQDADRLDAIGAIGIARAFAYGGSKHRELYNPESKPSMHSSFDAYKNSKGNTLNHFYEKLLLLKDMLNTATAKAIAVKRHQYMERFVEHFLEEWEMRDVE
ncbi:MAG: phosphohydrolase [Bacteroidetes bacterium HGW-Bacteroidetes-15]|nr:MAG: phosphohydrolase [Bacteroidetes bacterium HGW-Bacteroidetes-15]